MVDIISVDMPGVNKKMVDIFSVDMSGVDEKWSMLFQSTCKESTKAWSALFQSAKKRSTVLKMLTEMKNSEKTFSSTITKTFWCAFQRWVGKFR
jgi:hypothetical protein